MNTTAPSSTPSAAASIASSGLSVGAKVGIGVGVVGVFIALLACFLALFLRKRRKLHFRDDFVARTYVEPTELPGEIDREKCQGPAQAPMPPAEPTTVEEAPSITPSYFQQQGRAELSGDSVPAFGHGSPMLEGQAQEPSLRQQPSEIPSGSHQRGGAEGGAEAGPSSSSKPDEDVRNAQSLENDERHVKHESSDGTEAGRNNSSETDHLKDVRAAPAAQDDGTSLISRITDVATSNVPSGSHGIGQSDAGGIAGAVVGGLGIAVGGRALYYQRRQLKLQEREIELRETASGLSRRQAEIEQRLSEIEEREESLNSKAKQIKEDEQDIETNKLSLTRVREALQRQHQTILARRSADAEELASREKALKAQEIELDSKSKALEEREGVVQDYATVIQKKDDELQEMKSHNQSLEAAQRDREKQIEGLSSSVLGLKENERRWNSELGRLIQQLGASRGGMKDEIVDVELLSTDEMLQDVNERINVLQKAQADAERFQRDHIDRLNRTKATMTRLEEERTQKEQSHKEEVETLRDQYSKLQEQFHTQQETVLANSLGNNLATELVGSASPSEEVDYNQEIQDALEQVSRLKQRFTALQNRKIDSQPKQSRASASVRPHPVNVPSEVLHPSTHNKVHFTLSAISESSSASYHQEGFNEAPDSNTSGSIHDASSRGDQHDKDDNPASHNIQFRFCEPEQNTVLINNGRDARSNQSNLTNMADPSNLEWGNSVCNENLSHEAVTCVDSVFDVSTKEEAADPVILLPSEDTMVKH